MWQAFCVERTIETIDPDTVLARLKELTACTPHGCHDALHLHTPTHAMHALLPIALALAVAIAALARKSSVVAKN